MILPFCLCFLIGPGLTKFYLVETAGDVISDGRKEVANLADEKDDVEHAYTERSNADYSDDAVEDKTDDDKAARTAFDYAAFQSEVLENANGDYTDEYGYYTDYPQTDTNAEAADDDFADDDAVSMKDAAAKAYEAETEAKKGADYSVNSYSEGKGSHTKKFLVAVPLRRGFKGPAIKIFKKSKLCLSDSQSSDGH